MRRRSESDRDDVVLCVACRTPVTTRGDGGVVCADCGTTVTVDTRHTDTPSVTIQSSGVVVEKRATPSGDADDGPSIDISIRTETDTTVRVRVRDAVGETATHPAVRFEGERGRWRLTEAGHVAFDGRLAPETLTRTTYRLPPDIDVEEDLVSLPTIDTVAVSKAPNGDIPPGAATGPSSESGRLRSDGAGGQVTAGDRRMAHSEQLPARDRDALPIVERRGTATDTATTTARTTATATDSTTPPDNITAPDTIPATDTDLLFQRDVRRDGDCHRRCGDHRLANGHRGLVVGVRSHVSTIMLRKNE